MLRTIVRAFHCEHSVFGGTFWTESLITIDKTVKIHGLGNKVFYEIFFFYLTLKQPNLKRKSVIQSTVICPKICQPKLPPTRLLSLKNSNYPKHIYPFMWPVAESLKKLPN